MISRTDVVGARRRQPTRHLMALTFALAFVLVGAAHAQAPVIDVHLHALEIDSQGPPPVAVCIPMRIPAHDPRVPFAEVFARISKKPLCARPVWSPTSDDSLRDATLAILDRRNVIGVLSGAPERVAAWRARAPERVIAARVFNVAVDSATPAELAAAFDRGEFAVLGEVVNQYSGIGPDHPRFEPFWAIAEEKDIPVGIHIGPGPPGAPYLAPEYRMRLSDPLLLEDVLVRHPKLRVYVMHAAWPMRDNLLALLYAHPQVYVDTGVLQLAMPRREYHAYLDAIVSAGYGDRVMFGSDQMVWPGLIEEGMRAIEEARFLSTQQKRDIFYNNAARFLRLRPEVIERHHRLAKARRSG
jgi:uncharacterized protein